MEHQRLFLAACLAGTLCAYGTDSQALDFSIKSGSAKLSTLPDGNWWQSSMPHEIDDRSKPVEFTLGYKPFHWLRTELAYTTGINIKTTSYHVNDSCRAQGSNGFDGKIDESGFVCRLEGHTGDGKVSILSLNAQPRYCVGALCGFATLGVSQYRASYDVHYINSQRTETQEFSSRRFTTKRGIGAEWRTGRASSITMQYDVYNDVIAQGKNGGNGIYGGPMRAFLIGSTIHF